MTVNANIYAKLRETSLFDKRISEQVLFPMVTIHSNTAFRTYSDITVHTNRLWKNFYMIHLCLKSSVLPKLT